MAFFNSKKTAAETPIPEVMEEQKTLWIVKKELP